MLHKAASTTKRSWHPILLHSFKSTIRFCRTRQRFVRGGFPESLWKHGNTDIASFCGARTELRCTSVFDETALVVIRTIQHSFADQVYTEGHKVSFLTCCATCSVHT